MYVGIVSFVVGGEQGIEGREGFGRVVLEEVMETRDLPAISTSAEHANDGGEHLNVAQMLVVV